MPIANPFKPKRATDDLLDEGELLKEIMNRADEELAEPEGYVSDTDDLTRRLEELKGQALAHIDRTNTYMKEVQQATTQLLDRGRQVVDRKRHVVRMLDAALQAGKVGPKKIPDDYTPDQGSVIDMPNPLGFDAGGERVRHTTGAVKDMAPPEK